jgi:hypothetical protein
MFWAIVIFCAIMAFLIFVASLNSGNKKLKHRAKGPSLEATLTFSKTGENKSDKEASHVVSSVDCENIIVEDSSNSVNGGPSSNSEVHFSGKQCIITVNFYIDKRQDSIDKYWAQFKK